MPDTPPSQAATIAVRESGVSAFDYSIIPLSHREWLRTSAANIRELAYRTVANVVEAGLLLKEARSKIKPRTFRRWCEGELPWSRAHSYRLITVAEQFGPIIGSSAQRFHASALYLLASTSVKPEARTLAIQLAETKTVTIEDAKQILEATRQPRDLAKKELRTYEQGTKSLHGKIIPPPAEKSPWQMFEALFSRCESVHISRIEDGEPDDDETVSMTVYPGQERLPMNVVSGSLKDAVEALVKKESANKHGAIRPRSKPAKRSSGG